MPRLAYWLSAAFFAALVLAKFDPQTGFTSLIRFGEKQPAPRLAEIESVWLALAPDSSGYDGQFYAQIALDPTLRHPGLAAALDAPAYRARRILAPATAFALGLGRRAWILQIYALLNVACWFALAILLYREIGPASATAFARWSACLFSLGVLDSVRQSLVDLPALLLLVVAVRSTSTAPSRPPLLWCTLGHLAKETNLLASLALTAAPGPNRRRLVIFALSAVPLVLWMGYVNFRFPASGESGFGNFTWPLLGALQQLQMSARAISAGDFDPRHTFALLAVLGFGVQCAVLLICRSLANPWWRIGAAYGALLLVLGPWVWSGYWAACRAVLPLTVAFNLLLPANRAFWPLWILGNLTLLHGIWRFL
ncbi:MAG: hypothetical protein C0518_15250 [Opitutus sp.]|nr:hypothetical protein [Opitutus sp.]